MRREKLQVRHERIDLRVSPDEKTRWMRAARKSGLQLSQWIRMILNAQTGQRQDKRNDEDAPMTQPRPNDPRPFCVACGKRWVPDEGVDATCTDCGCRAVTVIGWPHDTTACEMLALLKAIPTDERIYVLALVCKVWIETGGSLECAR